MCGTCGCAGGDDVTVTDPATGERTVVRHGARNPAHEHHHGHDHHHGDGHHHHDHEGDDHGHHHHHGDGPVRTVTLDVERAVLEKNDRAAERNRAWFEGREILALNLVSSPGAGKTALLERTIRDVGPELAISVIEGDQQTLRDAERIRAAGAAAVQVNTGTGCHLEADMVRRGLDALRPAFGSTVMIENVGNLVCPAMFDLGERAKVVVLSVTEGDDKPLKYPHMFRAATLMVVSKIDLLPHVDFDVAACEASARRIHPEIATLRLSARTGEGLAAWYDWLRAARRGGAAAA